MHVYHLLEDYKTGGINQVINSMTSHFVKYGHTVNAIKVSATQPFSLKQIVRLNQKILKHSKTEAVFLFHTAKLVCVCFPSVAFLGWGQKATILYHFHNPYFQEFSFYLSFIKTKNPFLWIKVIPYYFYDFIACHVVHRVFCFSQFAQKQINTLFFCHNTVVIPPGKTISPPTQTQLKNTQAKRIFNLLYIGRIDPRKGYHLFLQLPSQLKKYQKDLGKKIEFTFMSDFNNSYTETKALRKAISQDHYPEITFVNNPSRTKIKQAILSADVVIMPSLALESFGLVATESLSLGVPVIAYPTGALPEILHQHPQLLSPQPTLESLTKTIIKVIKMPQKKLKNALLKTSEKYTWNPYLETITSLHKELQITHKDLK